jgi:hypothetical protein
MADYLNRRVPTTAEINAGITQFNNAQQRKPGATFNISKDLYGPAVGPAPVTGLGSFNTRPAATRPRPRPKPAAAATAAAPVAAAPAAAAPAAKPAAASPWSAGNLWGDAKDLAILGGGALALPAAATGDLLAQGATYALGGDPDTLEGGRWAASEAVRGAMGDAWSRGSDRASAQNASLLRMIGAKPAVDPNQVAAEAGAAQARKRREAMAANTAAAPATAAAAPAAAKPAVTAPAAPQVDWRGATPQGKVTNNGSYYIGGDGVKRMISWDEKGNLGRQVVPTTAEENATYQRGLQEQTLARKQQSEAEALDPTSRYAARKAAEEAQLMQTMRDQKLDYGVRGTTFVDGVQYTNTNQKGWISADGTTLDEYKAKRAARNNF